MIRAPTLSSMDYDASSPYEQVSGSSDRTKVATLSEHEMSSEKKSITWIREDYKASWLNTVVTSFSMFPALVIWERSCGHRRQQMEDWTVPHCAPSTRLWRSSTLNRTLEWSLGTRTNSTKPPADGRVWDHCLHLETSWKKIYTYARYLNRIEFVRV